MTKKELRRRLAEAADIAAAAVQDTMAEFEKLAMDLREALQKAEGKTP